MFAQKLGQFGRLFKRPADRKVYTKRKRLTFNRARLRCDPLEGRVLLDAVSWDGGGGNFDWNNPLNWETDALPTASDTALIASEGTFAVTLSSNVTIAGLTLGGGTGVQTLDTAGRVLTVNGPTTIASSGALLLNGSAVFADNDFTNNGRIEFLDGGFAAALTVTNGALVNAPSGVIRSAGTGSALITGELDNQGVIRVEENLEFRPANLFRSTVGTLDVPAGKKLQVQAAVDSVFCPDW